MADVVLFHHVQGLTEGVLAFAEELRAGGHRVHTPDLYEGLRPATLDEGMAQWRSVGERTLQERARRALAELPPELVYAGFSAGAGMAQEFAQLRPGTRGALLYEGFTPVTGEWAVGPWPDGLRVQVHGMDGDPFFGLEGAIEAAQSLVDTAGPDVAELFVYRGDVHLFTDAFLPTYDAPATALVLQRSREFLDRLG